MRGIKAISTWYSFGKEKSEAKTKEGKGWSERALLEEGKAWAIGTQKDS